jgi:pre-mRNA-splicing factor CWC26
MVCSVVFRLRQRDDEQKNIEEALHEISKPLARGKDDEDLDRHLREQDRDGDPMLAYMKKKKDKPKAEKGKIIGK